MVSSARVNGDSTIPVSNSTPSPAAISTRAFLASALAQSTQTLTAAFAKPENLDTEISVHASRVAARKLRNTIALIQRIESNSKLEELSKDSKRSAKSLAKLRELDVLLRELNQFDWPAKLSAGAKQLIHTLTRMRMDCVKQQTAQPESKPTQSKILDFKPADAKHKSPHTEMQMFAAGDFDKPASRIAARLSDHLLRRAKKRARKLSSFSDRQRHDFRIAIKNLRYGLELFAPLFDAKKRYHRYLNRANKLQLDLGICSDATSAQTLVAELAPQLEPDEQAAATHFLKSIKKQARKATAKLPGRWHQLKKQAPFWK